MDMNDKLLIDRRTGETIEFIKATESMYDAGIDAVGLWQIVPEGRDRYGLEGDDLRLPSPTIACGWRCLTSTPRITRSDEAREPQRATACRQRRLACNLACTEIPLEIAPSETRKSAPRWLQAPMWCRLGGTDVPCADGAFNHLACGADCSL